MSVRIIKDTHLSGMEALAQRLLAGRERVMVGVPAGAREEDGTSIALIAAVHEFGSETASIPERSFGRTGIKHGQQQFAAVNFDSLKKVVNGSMSMHGALERLGEAAAGAVKEEITHGDFKPLKPATIARKGSEKPLIDSGSLRAAITYVIEGSEL